MMDRFREAAGPDANLQTLARGINVVALSQQPKDMIDLHARMFKKTRDNAYKKTSTP